MLLSVAAVVLSVAQNLGSGGTGFPFLEIRHPAEGLHVNPLVMQSIEPVLVVSGSASHAEYLSQGGRELDQMDLCAVIGNAQCSAGNVNPG